MKTNAELEDLSEFIPDQSLGYQIRHAYRIFVKVLADELRIHRVTSSQWSALRVLWKRDGLSQVELADRMMIEKASLTPLIKAIASGGLITRRRNKQDRRLVNIYLTPAGRRLESVLLPLVGKINERASKHMSKAEVGQLHVLLARVATNMQSGSAV